MDKPTLSINKEDLLNIGNTLGKTEFLTCLVESNLFNITYHNYTISTFHGQFAATVFYNDKKIYIDWWEYPAPTYSYEVYNANFDLIIKLQDVNLTNEQFEKNCCRKRTLADLLPEQRLTFWKKIVPWTFFCSRMMKQFVNKEDQIEKLPIERLAFFCGKSWKARNGMLKKIQSDGIECVFSSQETAGMIPLTDQEYIHKMKTSKYGLVLHGRASHLTEAKNRREIDYMMLTKPLLLNYKPYYYNPLIAGKHYIYIDENTDLKLIDKQYNIEEIASNGYEWYKNNASKEGVTKTFLQIVKEKIT